MKGFIEFFDTSREEYILLNVSQIILVKPGTDHYSHPRRYPDIPEGEFRVLTEADLQVPDTRDSDHAEVYITSQCRLIDDITGYLVPQYGHGDKLGQTIPYREVVKMIRDATKEEKGTSPTPPEGKRRNGGDNQNTSARAREKFAKPTLEEVAAYVREKGYAFDAEEFWCYYESNGWRVGRSAMKSWRSACVTWQKKREQDAKADAARAAHIDAKMAEREAARMAHIDAKMDEREARRETRATQKSAVRRRPDNWIGCSDAERKEFIDGLA